MAVIRVVSVEHQVDALLIGPHLNEHLVGPVGVLYTSDSKLCNDENQIGVLYGGCVAGGESSGEVDHDAGVDKPELVQQVGDAFRAHGVGVPQAVRAGEDVRRASGEHEPDLDGFMDLIDTRAVDYVQMDVLCQGGFKMASQVFEGVRKHGLRFAFHSWGTVLEVLAAAHIGICWSEYVVEWLEYPCHANAGRPGMYPFLLADEILQDPLDIENGYLKVPDHPGLGVAVDERVIERYPFIPGPWSYFRLDSPAETIAVIGDHSVKWVKGESDD